MHRGGLLLPLELVDLSLLGWRKGVKRFRFPETFDPLKHKVLLSEYWQTLEKLPSAFFHCCNES